MDTIFDVIILGAGPAGLSAAIYAGRSQLNTLLIEKGLDGGQIAATADIENYPGQLLEGESGMSLIARMTQQAEKQGVQRAYDEIQSLDLEGPVKILQGTMDTYRGRSLIIATGASPRPIGCENEQRFTGQGISYCATCDGAFYKGLDVYVVGGGNSAVEEAIFLTKFARKVTIIHRRDKLRADRTAQERAFANPKIHFLWDSVVERADGENFLDTLVIRNLKTDARTIIKPTEGDRMLGLFGFVGYAPNSKLFENHLPLQNGYIAADADMRTGISGVYAAGDIRVKSVRQVVTAAADGAIAVISAEHDLRKEM